MKKKILIILFALIIPICLLFAGCSSKIENKQTEEHLMVCIDDFTIGGYGAFILVHKETRVMYMAYYQGGTTVMLDKDGRPLIYEGEL